MDVVRGNLNVCVRYVLFDICQETTTPFVRWPILPDCSVVVYVGGFVFVCELSFLYGDDICVLLVYKMCKFGDFVENTIDVDLYYF